MAPIPSLKSVIALLRRCYGKPRRPVATHPFDLVLLENVGYLVNDARRAEVFQILRRAVGTDPDAILGTPTAVLERLIEAGGMRPPLRAEKLHRAAAIASEVGGRGALLRLMRQSPERSRRLLKRFPGIGEPGADKLLLFARLKRTLAPDSNILRVLSRLGFGRAEGGYARAYRSVTQAVAPELPLDFNWLLAAHRLLRQHGQEVCRRSEPLCQRCPVSVQCRWFAQHRA